MTFKGTFAWLLTVTVSVSACAGSPTRAESVTEHPSFPCLQWWLASTKVAGLAGIAPWASEHSLIMTYEELFDFADSSVPDSSISEAMRQLRTEMPDETADEDERERWRVRVLLSVYDWALFHLDLAEEIVETSEDIREEDRQVLLDYMVILQEFVEDQSALVLPMLSANLRIDVTTLGVITGTRASDKLVQAWNESTDETYKNLVPGVHDASMDVCGEDLVGIGPRT